MSFWLKLLLPGVSLAFATGAAAIVAWLDEETSFIALAPAAMGGTAFALLSGRFVTRLHRRPRAAAPQPVFLRVDVARSCALDRASRTLLSVAVAHRDVLDEPAPQVHLMEFDADFFSFDVCAYTRLAGAAKRSLQRALALEIQRLFLKQDVVIRTELDELR